MRLLLHTLIIILLTLLTQVGGILYLLAILAFRKKTERRRLKRITTFLVLYLITVFMVIPYVAPVFGRVRISDSDNLQAHSFLYKLANRNYVREELNNALGEIATEFEGRHKGIKLVYLDASFPFFDGFPLLPHLSHDDGRKVDVSLVYHQANGALSNDKPSVSGYGVYEGPAGSEFNQTKDCKDRGNWLYDFPKYLTFGRINKSIRFSEAGTRALIQMIVKQPAVGKVFIEPHLKSRLNLTSDKVRFHGCQAVRHDDHIHFQLK